MSSIPTTYNGIRFRSRLEAKWACFWDLQSTDRTNDPIDFQTHWHYEPFELPGWIPDFLITRGFFAPSLIEIKPITGLHQFLNSADWAKIQNALTQDSWFNKNEYGSLNINGISPICCWQLASNGEWQHCEPYFGYNTSMWRETEQNWARASNETQWKPPQRKRRR
jgi:hypothetical protein